MLKNIDTDNYMGLNKCYDDNLCHNKAYSIYIVNNSKKRTILMLNLYKFNN